MAEVTRQSYGLKQRLILAAIGLAAGLALGETLLAWAQPQVHRRPDVWQFDAQLGWSHIPGATGRLVSPEFDVEVRINSDGLRDREYLPQKPAEARRLLLFGDSFIEGWGVPVEHSVAKVLENLLRSRSSAATGDVAGEVEVINFGVAGYGTDQALLLFQQTGRHYGADRVVVFFYGNDLWNNALSRGIGSERGLKPRFTLTADGGVRLTGAPVRKVGFWERADARPWSTRMQRYLFEHWHLYALLHRALAPSAIGAGSQADFYGALYGVDPGRKYEELWTLSARLMHTFRVAIRQAGAEMVLVYVPSIVQIEEDNWQMKRELHELAGEFDLGKPNRRLRRIAAEASIPFLDLYEPFAMQARRGRVLYFRDSHWNGDGHALAAASLREFLDSPSSASAAGIGR